MLTWTALDVIYYKRPAILGSVQGMITGLVAITPAAGVIDGWAAIVMGVLSGSIPWLTMNLLGKKWPLRLVDDTLGVFHTHLVAGIVGGFFTGVFATIDGSAAFAITNPGGAIAGNGRQVWIQIVGFLFIIGWNVAWVSIILLGIRFILRIPLRYSEEILLIGDDAIHGEAAYEFEHVPMLDRDRDGEEESEGSGANGKDRKDRHALHRIEPTAQEMEV